jgi:hypothetical protein
VGGSSPVTHPTQFRASAPPFNGGLVLCRHPDAAMTRVSQTGASFWYRNLDFTVFRYQNGGREGASGGEPGTLYQGYDNRGREIELIVVEGEDYDLVVHAMPVDYRRRE